MSSFWCSFWSTHFDDELSHFIYNTVVSFHFVSFHSFWVYEMRQLIIKMSSSKWTSKWVHQNHHNELSHFTLSHFTHFELSEVGLDGAVCISVAVLQCELQCELQSELQSEMQCVGVGLMVRVYQCVVRSCLIVLLLRLITMYDSGIQSSFWVVRSCPIDLLLRLITTYESGIQSSESSHSNDWMPLSGVATISRLQVSFAKEPYKTDDILRKRHVILRSLLIVATPYESTIQTIECHSMRHSDESGCHSQTILFSWCWYSHGSSTY